MDGSPMGRSASSGLSGPDRSHVCRVRARPVRGSQDRETSRESRCRARALDRYGTGAKSGVAPAGRSRTARTAVPRGHPARHRDPPPWKTRRDRYADGAAGQPACERTENGSEGRSPASWSLRFWPGRSSGSGAGRGRCYPLAIPTRSSYATGSTRPPQTGSAATRSGPASRQPSGRTSQNPRPARAHCAGLQRHYPFYRKRAQGDGVCQPVNDVGKSCAGELHAHLKWWGLETERQLPCQSPTLFSRWSACSASRC
jgi:hypothetical protein